MDARRRALTWLWGAVCALVTLAFCAAVAVLAGRLVPARAHADYDWIRVYHGEARARDWRDGDFGGCCGKQDCFPVSIKPETRDGKHGYLTGDGDWVPHADTHPSRDPAGRHWRCYQMLVIGGTLLKGKPRERCTFVNPGTF